MKKLKWISSDETVIKNDLLEAKAKEFELMARLAAHYKSKDRMQNKILIVFVLLCIVAVVAEHLRETKKI